MMGERVSVIRSWATCMAILGLTLLAACAKPEAPAPAPAENAPAPADSKAAEQAHVDRTMAYEHTVSVELRKEALAPRLRDAQNACEQRAELGCTLLDITLDEKSSVPSAHIQMRLAPGQVDPMIAIAARGGRILSRRTHGEDLAEPIADTQRRIALLSLHRDRLSEFLKNPQLKIKDVMELSKEISSTQEAIESLSASKVNLQHRIDTEVLTLDLFPPEGAYAATETPVRNALRAFGDDFSMTLAGLIRFIAVILPLLLVAALAGGGWWLVRRFRNP